MVRLVALAVLASACTIEGTGTIEGSAPDGGGPPGPGDGGGAGAGGDAGDTSYQAVITALPGDVRDEMVGVSWHEDLDCPPLDTLALIRMPHWGFDGAIHQGEIVVAASSADAIAQAFGAMYDARFPIERIVRVDAYGGSDDASMAANNTSAFNCRSITGGGALSQHSYGTAIDLNPVQNPYISGSLVLPEAGEDYATRSPTRPGMVVRPGPALDAFTTIGWQWAGDWDDPIDYQHFSANGL